MYIRLIKSYGVYDRWEILKQRVDGKEYYIISFPDGKFYKDSEGKIYKFKTREDALEELAFLKGEHDADEKRVESSKKILVNVFDIDWQDEEEDFPDYYRLLPIEIEDADNDSEIEDAITNKLEDLYGEVEHFNYTVIK